MFGENEKIPDSHGIQFGAGPFLWLSTAHHYSQMDLNDLHPPDDYSHRFFIWHEWILVGSFSLPLCQTSAHSFAGKWALDPRERLRVLCNVHVL